MRFPSERHSLGPYLFWSFDFMADPKGKDSTIMNHPLSLLEDLSAAENIESLPDPIVHVIGVTFEKNDVDTADRSQSPSFHNKSATWRDGDLTDREIATSRTIGGQNQALEMSAEPLSSRDKYGVGTKDANKSAIPSLANKYTKLKGRGT